jgi:Homeodomain-like domain
MELSESERRTLVVEMHDQGRSTRQIAKALGLSQSMVARDLRAAGPPAPIEESDASEGRRLGPTFAPTPATELAEEFVRQQWSPLGWEGNVGSPTPAEQKEFRQEWREWSRGRSVGLGRLRPRRPSIIFVEKDGPDRP